MTTRQTPSLRRLTTWPLHRRIAAALVTVCALLIALVASAAVLQVELRQTQHVVISDYYTSLRNSQSYFIAMVNSETAVRGYALSGQPTALEPLDEAGRPWETSLVEQISPEIPDDQIPMTKLRAVEEASRAWYREWAEPAVRQTEAGRRLSSADVDRGKMMFDRFRNSYEEYISELRHSRQENVDRLRALTSLLFAAVVATALIAVVGGIVLWYLMRTWVSVPVAHLAAEVRMVRDNELGHQVASRGPREFIELGQDVEAMRRRLVAQIAAVEQAGQQVAAARSALEDQAEELQRSNRELEQFAYVASHDLQEPLRKVASFCQMLQRRYAGQLDERADQYIHFAVDGAKRMQQLINDLLEFSRVGRLSTPRVDVDLADCLRGAMFNLASAREESGAEVTWEDLPHVLGEAPLLTQLLQNLIGNAIKFRSEAPPRIHVAARRVGDLWEISVADNGIGIEPEYADRVFLIFQRLHAKEVYGGTGIGLAMCKKIVEHHGGRIWVDATAPAPAPEGAAPAAPEGATPEGAPDDPSGGTASVLDRAPGTGTTIRFTLPVIRPEAPGGRDQEADEAVARPSEVLS